MKLLFNVKKNLLKNLFSWFLCLCSAFFLASCYVDNVSDDINYNQLNDRQIQDYIRRNNLTGVQSTGSGMYYKVTTSNPTGRKPVNGDSLYIFYKGTLVDGTVVDTTSEKRNRPLKFVLGTTVIVQGLEEALKQMREGESGIVLVPSYLGLGRNGTWRIPPYSVLVYEVKINKLITEEDVINKYIADSSYVVTTKTDDGIRYIQKSAGATNAKVGDGAFAIVNYKGRLLNNIVFDSKADSTFGFVVGRGQVIQGWDKGIKLMDEGAKGIWIIPSALAYGANGSGNRIPPFSPLIFEVTHVKSQKRRIVEYITTNGWTDTTSTSSGLYWRIERQPTGTILPSNNSRVTVNFVRRFLTSSTGNTYISEAINKQFTMNLPDTDLPAGLKEGLFLMKVGEKRRLMLPDYMAFGATGQGIIPGKTPIVYEVELLEILN